MGPQHRDEEAACLGTHMNPLSKRRRRTLANPRQHTRPLGPVLPARPDGGIGEIEPFKIYGLPQPTPFSRKSELPTAHEPLLVAAKAMELQPMSQTSSKYVRH